MDSGAGLGFLRGNQRLVGVPGAALGGRVLLRSSGSAVAGRRRRQGPVVRARQTRRRLLQESFEVLWNKKQPWNENHR